MEMLYYLILLFICLQCIQGQLDGRCYLEGGGSTENFLASEDVAVGTVIGKLRINGDPSIDSGDINLSLRERDSPITIAPGTKDLVLISPLDKEGKRGPSSVYVNVICDRRHINDPSFVIPVSIRVTDINDNAPKWIAAPYSLSLSEVTVIGTRILQGVRAIDDDQPGPFSTVEYQVLPGPYSDYVSFVSPLEGTLVLKKNLDYETLKNFTIKLRAQDQGIPPKFSDTFLRVTINDADDQNPKFLRETYYGELLQDGTLGEVKISPEPIKAVDQDEGIKSVLQYSISPQSTDARFFSVNPTNGAISLTSQIGTADQPYTATLVVKATQVDNVDRYALATVIITKKGIRGNNEVKFSFLQSQYQAKVKEDLGVGSRVLTLSTNRPGKHLQYFIVGDDESKFSIGSLGELILRKGLDYEQNISHNFVVQANDGVSNSTTNVNIDVLDVNDWDPRFRQSHYEYRLPSMEKFTDPVALGKLEAADGDVNDQISFSVKGQHSNMFTIDQRGVLWYRGKRPNVTVIHLLATATDSGQPPKSSSVPITVIVDDPMIAKVQWMPGIFGAFGIVMSLFVLVIVGLSIYIYKSKKPKLRNRVHSANSTQNSMHSAATLVTREKMMGGLHLGGGLGIRNFDETSTSPGASTILAASLEREAQRVKDRENYTATVRSIITRAQTKEGIFYNDDDDIERDSISNSETNNRTTWNHIQHHVPKDGNIGLPTTTTTRKNLSWDNGEYKTDIHRTNEVIGASENNLTVYF